MNDEPSREALLAVGIHPDYMDVQLTIRTPTDGLRAATLLYDDGQLDGTAFAAMVASGGSLVRTCARRVSVQEMERWRLHEEVKKIWRRPRRGDA